MRIYWTQCIRTNILALVYKRIIFIYSLCYKREIWYYIIYIYMIFTLVFKILFNDIIDILMVFYLCIRVFYTYDIVFIFLYII